MKQKDIPESKFSTNPDCPWCQGRGLIAIPDYEQIGALGLFDRCMADEWVYKPMKSTYCHQCYEAETPVDTKGKHYPTLLDSLKHAKFAGSQYWDLLLSCLHWHLKAHHQPEFVAKHLGDLLRGAE